ncbi:MAG: SHOCT domain-containing protein [Nitrospirales bacterium]
MNVNHPKRTVSIRMLLLALVVILAHQSCVGSLPSTRPVCGNCEETDRFVRLEKMKAKISPDAQPPFTHPFTLDPKEWTEILAAIYVQKIKPGFLIGEGKGSEEQAFTTEEIHYLSSTLPKAFEQALSDEMVVYALSHSPVPAISEISTGGLFFKNEQLYVMLANHHFAVSMPSIRELAWEHPLYSQGISYVLVQGLNQRIVKPEFSFSGPNPLTVVVAYKDLLLAPPNPTKDDLRPTPGTSSTGREQSTELSIEDRFETLNRLRTQGLITEEEFQQKKKELLDRL